MVLFSYLRMRLLASIRLHHLGEWGSARQADQGDDDGDDGLYQTAGGVTPDWVTCNSQLHSHDKQLGTLRQSQFNFRNLGRGQ